MTKVELEINGEVVETKLAHPSNLQLIQKEFSIIGKHRRGGPWAVFIYRPSSLNKWAKSAIPSVEIDRKLDAIQKDKPYIFAQDYSTNVYVR